MKKLGLLVAPLIAIPLLASCGGGDKPTPTTFYKANATNTDHLIFTTDGTTPLNNIDVEAGKEFTFKMKVKDDANEIVYKLPAALDIKISDSEVKLEEGYHIEETTQYLEATVTIDANKVIGNINISGDSLPINCYATDIACYGVTSDCDEQYHFCEEELAIEFKKNERNYDLPTADNIYLSADNNDWIHPSIGEGNYQYNNESHKLTIAANGVNSLLKVRVRSPDPDYQLLEELTWKQISDYSIAGRAPYIFNLGEQKTVDTINQKVRIIGFNYDCTNLEHPDESKVGITFEFVNTISGFKTYWNNKQGDKSTNEDFVKNSNLNDCLQLGADGGPAGEIYKKMPIDLMNVVKIVNKKIELHNKESDYNTQLFPLSNDEIDGNDNNTYEYYKKDSKSRRVKDNYYWLRSPRLYFVKDAWRIAPDGGIYEGNTVSKHTFGVAPAFCI